MDNRLEIALRLALRFDLGYSADKARELSSDLTPHLEKRLEVLEAYFTMGTDIEAVFNSWGDEQ